MAQRSGFTCEEQGRSAVAVRTEPVAGDPGAGAVHAQPRPRGNKTCHPGCIVGHEGRCWPERSPPIFPSSSLYLYERLRGTPEQTIWAVCYQNPYWLAVIHGGHSIPLAALAAGSLLIVGFQRCGFFASVALHAMCDLPRPRHRRASAFSAVQPVSLRQPAARIGMSVHGRKVGLSKRCSSRRPGVPHPPGESVRRGSAGAGQPGMRAPMYEA